ncbi:CBU_0592 family membrane protein [Fulvimonas yonginensis]|uniref:CBU-0592-like domain-containing protein n=1 Tax=Fulvimonas yonginensis TaxID=1495200 RepID=A0ABU8JF78_9GAMM
MSTLQWHDWAGFVGVLLVLLAFLLLQAHKLHGNGLTYQLMNVFGALGVTLSLLFGAFNVSAFALELAWMAIGIFGIVRNARRRRERPLAPPPDTSP